MKESFIYLFMDIEMSIQMIEISVRKFKDNPELKQLNELKIECNNFEYLCKLFLEEMDL